MQIDLFISPGCPHAEDARQLVEVAIAESGAAATFTVHTIADYETARARRYFGSPTIRIDGVEVEYAEREPEEFSTGCRYYNTAEGWQPLPRKELILRGIARARQREQRTGPTSSSS